MDALLLRCYSREEIESVRELRMFYQVQSKAADEKIFDYTQVRDS